MAYMHLFTISLIGVLFHTGKSDVIGNFSSSCPKGCYNDFDAKTVECVDSACQTFPTDFKVDPHEVVHIDVSYNKIHYLPNLVYPELEFLDLSTNAIANFAGGTFGGCRKLKHLNLSHNVLDTIEGSMFKMDLDLLETMDLSFNRITTIKARTFQFLSKLQHLNISHNRIMMLEDYALSYQYDLKQLHLEYNKLDKVKLEYFEGLRKLEYLSLRGNQIQFIQEDSFTDLYEIMRIDLGENVLRDIRENVFHEGLAHPFSKLQAIHLDNNQISIIHDHTFSPFVKLMYIFLDDNELESINTTKPFPISLKEISLQRNTKLMIIKNGTFSGLSRLTKVNLNGCYKLHEIEAGTFDEEKSSVEMFDVTQCGLTHLAPHLLDWTRLHTLELSGNPWECDCYMTWTKDKRTGLPSHVLHNMQCSSPHQLKGKTLNELEVVEMSCEFYAKYRHMIGMTLVVLATIVFLVVMVLFLYAYRQRLCPAKYKKPGGTYQTLYTVDEQADACVSIQADDAVEITQDTKLLDTPDPVAV